MNCATAGFVYRRRSDHVRFILRTMQKEPEHITTYTIFTTTDCNARCFYCYEMGRSRIPMSDETAYKAATYIAAHCGGEKVHLHWFGGEPLFNKQVIDIICTDLTEKGIIYDSMMISNGYLFDKDTVEQAVSHWKLKSVQITLDGTEEIGDHKRCHSGCHGEKIRCTTRRDGRGCGYGAGKPEKDRCAGCVNQHLRRRSRAMAFCFTAM